MKTKGKTPGEILKELLRKHGIGRDDFAKHIGWSRKAVDRLCVGETGIDATKALLLEDVFGISAEKWMTAQVCADVRTERVARGGAVAVRYPREHQGCATKYGFEKMRIGAAVTIDCQRNVSPRTMQRRIFCSLWAFNQRNGLKIKIATRTEEAKIKIWRIE